MVTYVKAGSKSKGTAIALTLLFDVSPKSYSNLLWFFLHTTWFVHFPFNSESLRTMLFKSLKRHIVSNVLATSVPRRQSFSVTDVLKPKVSTAAYLKRPIFTFRIFKLIQFHALQHLKHILILCSTWKCWFPVSQSFCTNLKSVKVQTKSKNTKVSCKISILVQVVLKTGSSR